MGIQRHAEFVNRLKSCPDILEVQKEVNVEHEYLASSYKTISSLKGGFTSYRNYVKGHSFCGGNVQADTIVSMVLNKLKLTEEELDVLAEKHKQQIVKDMSNLRQIRHVYPHIETSINILKSRRYLDQIIGLAALTGRRLAEIATSAEFEFVGPNKVLFYGQLKTKGREGVFPYEIPTLCDAHLLIAALQRLRFERPHLVNHPQLFHDRCSKELNKRTKQIYKPFYEEELTPKDLRPIYAEICYKLHNANPLVSRALYYAKILGHGELDVVTAQSYDDFRIKDPDVE